MGTTKNTLTYISKSMKPETKPLSGFWQGVSGSKAIALAVLFSGLILLWEKASSVNPLLVGNFPLMKTRIEGTGYPLPIWDPVGQKEVLWKQPNRVVSAVLMSDQILCEILPPDYLVGVTYLARNPGISLSVDKIPREAVVHMGEIESVLSMEPDLVVVAAYSNSNLVRFLSALNIPVVRITDFHSFNDVMNTIRMLGKVTGWQNRSEMLVGKIQQRIKRVQKRVAGLKRPRVLYFSENGSTQGLHTLLDDKITLAGGINVASEIGIEGAIQMSHELAISLEPDVVLVSDWNYKKLPDFDPTRFIVESAAWADTAVVKNGKVHALPAAVMSSVSQNSVEALEAIARILHPEAI